MMLVVPLAYGASFGPFVGLCSRDYLPKSVKTAGEYFYFPFVWVAFDGPNWLYSCVDCYVKLWLP